MSSSAHRVHPIFSASFFGPSSAQLPPVPCSSRLAADTRRVNVIKRSVINCSCDVHQKHVNVAVVYYAQQAVTHAVVAYHIVTCTAHYCNIIFNCAHFLNKCFNTTVAFVLAAFIVSTICFNAAKIVTSETVASDGGYWQMEN